MTPEQQYAMYGAKLDWLCTSVRNWALDCIGNQKQGNMMLDEIKITIDRFGQLPIPLTPEQRKRLPECARKEDEDAAKPIHFSLQAGHPHLGNGRLVACNNEYEGAQAVVDAFRWCYEAKYPLKKPTPPIDDLKLNTFKDRQLSFDF